MAKVTVQTKILAPAEEVWRLVGGWNALPEWHPAVETSEIEEGGHKRRLRMVDGTEFTEILEKFDGEARTYTYSIVTSPMPLSDYRATIRVQREGDKSIIVWDSTFNPVGKAADDLARAIEEFYQAGFDNLRKLMGA